MLDSRGFASTGQYRKPHKATVPKPNGTMALFYAIEKFSCGKLLRVKMPAESGYKKQTMLLEDVKAFFKLAIIKVILLHKEVMKESMDH